jgi:hypothetical protein
MDVDFMVTDSLEAIRPKMVLLKKVEDAAMAVDEMFASTIQCSGCGFLSLQFLDVNSFQLSRLWRRQRRR